ncbi:trk system potassium uptake protein TrkA [Lachnospiraceae bacterium NK3A20]|jgi:trk system potassium uptake protein TrkA|nr:trk system potassium uptake protein TrkA [Lachnospiraceae bacterium NK3A20]
MRIIVVGCGKVGMAIVERLSTEGHDIAVIDTDSKVIADVTDNFDVMGIVGNGASYSTLSDAGIEDTNLLIAATDSDELNLLCCLFARKAGDCRTIARVRSPLYRGEIGFIKDELGLSMTINPEYAAATEISRLLRFPSAIKIDTFGKGRVELLQFVIPEGSLLDHLALQDMPGRVKSEVLVCAVQRGNDVVIPNGAYVLQAGDTISIVASPVHARNFFSRIGVDTHRVGNAMIVGGGTIAYYLAKQLINYGIDVKILEKDLHRCEELSDLLPEAIIINGDGTDQDLLREEGIETCDAFVTLTGIDEENIFVSMFAQQSNPGVKIITKTNRISIDNIIDKFNLGSMIHPKNITAEYIVRYVRAMQNSIGSNVETLYNIVENKAEALEFTVHEGAKVTGTPLSDLKLKDNVLIAGILRHNRFILPVGQTTIEVGDSVIIVTTHRGFGDIGDILR